MNTLSPQGNEPSAVEKAIERLDRIPQDIHCPNAINKHNVIVFLRTELQAMFEAGQKDPRTSVAEKYRKEGHTTGYQMGVKSAIEAIPPATKIENHSDKVINAIWNGHNLCREATLSRLSSLLTTDRKEEKCSFCNKVESRMYPEDGEYCTCHQTGELGGEVK